VGTTTSNRAYRVPQSSDAPNISSDMANLGADVDADMALVISQHTLPTTPAGTSSNGTITSGTTETRDAVLGNYSFTALAGVRYRVWLLNAGHQPTVSGDRFSCRVRYTTNGATPTASDTMAGTDTTFITVGTSGSQNFVVPHITTFVPGAGTITLAVFYVRIAGTGTVTPTGGRQLFAEAIGTL